MYIVCNNLHCHKKVPLIQNSHKQNDVSAMTVETRNSVTRLCMTADSMRHSTIQHMLERSHPALQFTLPTTAATLLSVDNGNNVDWSNSIDLQILTNITGSSVPSLALNNTLTSLHPHIIIALSQPTKQVRLINLGLRF